MGSNGLIDLRTPLSSVFNNPDKELVNSGVVGELWMKGGGEQPLLLYRDRAAVLQGGQDADSAPYLINGWGSDEDCAKGGSR